MAVAFLRSEADVAKASPVSKVGEGAWQGLNPQHVRAPLASPPPDQVGLRQHVAIMQEAPPS
eukprot:CAMPEP_0179131656 /NCGR_PEP_ID=MMETSP0796-20121207/62548_1 /TAXON_ID=73915 /ORGANISM="Pyrodinium bahamense, Strain pbaha01" /LENGTH=61 /DNA_ID=CAMNT_0020830585 /DNA_START=220 /DNA_END=405 /DNA_ORIENTATION=-